MKLNIPKDRFIVVCGYNASPRQAHIPVIESIMKVKQNLPRNIIFVFPMTYGDADYVSDVEIELKKAGLDYKI